MSITLKAGLRLKGRISEAGASVGCSHLGIVEDAMRPRIRFQQTPVCSSPWVWVGLTISEVLGRGATTTPCSPAPPLLPGPGVHSLVLSESRTQPIDAKRQLSFLNTFFLIFFNFLFYIGVWLINNVSISGMQQSDSVIQKHVSIFSSHYFPI